MKRDFDCDTCSWFENGRCVNLNRSAYYPCPGWLRRFDPEKYTMCFSIRTSPEYTNKPFKPTVNNTAA